MKIALLCGGKFSFPSIQTLVFEKYLCALGVATEDKSMITLLKDQSDQNNIDFISFSNKDELKNLGEWIQKNELDAVFCICFPYRLSKEILNLVPGKFINFHTGPLPQYRGPVPIFEVLKSMEEESAICAHLMSEDFDKGPIILQEYVKISENETFGTLTMKLSKRTALVAQNIAEMLEFGSTIPSLPQEDLKDARYYPKPEFEDTLIHWKEMHAQQIVCLINACNPWNNGADTMSPNFQFKIISAEVEDEEHEFEPGKVVRLNEQDELLVACIEDQLLKVKFLHSDYGFQSAKDFVHSTKKILGEVLLG